MAHALHEADGERARGNLHHRPRHVDGGAERHGKSGDALAHAVAHGLLEGHGYGGCRRRGAEGGEIGGQHVVEEPEGIAARNDAGSDKLVEQDEEVEDEDDHDDTGKDGKDMVSLARPRHVEEDAEDVDGQQGDDGLGDGGGDDCLEVGKEPLERGQLGIGDAQAYDEGEEQTTHHINERRHGDGEIGLDGGGLLDLGRGDAAYHVGEEPGAGAKGEKPGKDGIEIGYEHGDDQQPSGSATDIADGGGDQSDDDEGYHEAQKLAEDAIERDEHTG